MNEIKEKINTILDKGVIVSMGRCWLVCYKIWRRLPKEMKQKLTLVEGKNHYWLEDIDGNIYDPYSKIYSIDSSNYDYKVEFKYNPEKLKFSDTFNERFCESSRNMENVGIRKIFQFTNESLEEAKI